jgi:hypothetical protein
MSYLENLWIVAEFLLRNDFPAFEQLVNGYESLDKVSFIEKYQDIVGDDRNNYEDWTTFNFFFMFANHKGYLGMVDWSGESENGEIAQMVESILQKQGINGFGWNDEEFYGKDGTFYGKVQCNQLHRGEHPIVLFKTIDTMLQKIGYRIFFVDEGADNYRYSVLPKNIFSLISSIKENEYSMHGVDSLE